MKVIIETNTEYSQRVSEAIAGNDYSTARMEGVDTVNYIINNMNAKLIEFLLYRLSIFEIPTEECHIRLSNN
jgi:hypothetical protein